MTLSKLLDYLRVYASLKRNLADNLNREEMAEAYSDLVSEINRVELMLNSSGPVVTSLLKDSLETISH